MLSFVGPLLWAYFRGVWDSLRGLSKVFYLYRSSRAIRKAMNKSLVLNGAVFLGSLLLMTALRTAITRVFFLSDPVSVFDDAESLLGWALAVLWLTPLYLVSTVLSAPAYSAIAAHTHRIANLDMPAPLPADGDGDGAGSGSGDGDVDGEGDVGARGGGVSASANSKNSGGGGGGGFGALWQFMTTYAEEVYRLLVINVGMLLLFLLAALLGPFDVLLLLPGSALIYGVYLFDYRWSLEGLPTAVRLEVVETRWPYFVGMGTVLAASGVFFSRDYTGLGAYLGTLAATGCAPLFAQTAASASASVGASTGAVGAACAAAAGAARDVFSGTFSFFLGSGLYALLFPLFLVAAVLARPPQEIPTATTTTTVTAAAAAAATGSANAGSGAATGAATNASAGAGGAVGAGVGGGGGGVVVVRRARPIPRLVAVRWLRRLSDWILGAALALLGGDARGGGGGGGGSGSGRKKSARKTAAQQQQEQGDAAAASAGVKVD